MIETKVEGVGTDLVKHGMVQMLKGGVIMDVVIAEQVKITEDASAVAVMALERVPADIRTEGGVARMSDPDLIDSIINAVSIPVVAKAHTGHFAEAQALQSLGVDYIDESEVLTPAGYENHVSKWDFTVPFVHGAASLGEVLRRISEGAVMIRSRGEADIGDVSNAVTHTCTMTSETNRLASTRPNEVFHAAEELQAPYLLVKEVAETGKLPVVLFTAGGITTPTDTALMMQLGAEDVFVGSRIFKPGDPAKRAAVVVKTTAHFNESELAAEVFRSLGETMAGIDVHDLSAAQHPENRGWQAQINLEDTGAAFSRARRSYPVSIIYKEGC